MQRMGTFAIQFDVTEDGTCIPVPWSKDEFADDKITIVLEEHNNVVWIYYGKRNGLVKKRKALRQAESLRGHGYQVGKTIIGRQLSGIKEVDARMIDRVPEVKAEHEKLEKLFSMPFKKLEGECVSLGESGGVAPAPAPAAAPAPAPAAAPAPAPAAEAEPCVPVSEPAPDCIPVVDDYAGVDEFAMAKDPKLERKSTIHKQDEIKAGNLVMALLREFSDIYVSIKGNHVKVESLDGPICEFTIDGGKIKFSKDSFSGVDPSMKQQVQAHFLELGT